MPLKTAPPCQHCRRIFPAAFLPFPPVRNFPAESFDRDRAIAKFFRIRLDANLKAQLLQHSTMICVSSLHSAPLSVTSPSASAARISARFVMLFEPGTVISARTGLSSGIISMRSGEAFYLATDEHRWNTDRILTTHARIGASVDKICVSSVFICGLLFIARFAHQLSRRCWPSQKTF